MRLFLSILTFSLLQSSLAYGMTCSHYLRRVINVENRAQLKTGYKDLIFKTPEENKSWISKAFREKANGLFIEFTASMLKEMNDSIIKDIDLVTAIVNLHKEFNFNAFQKVIDEMGLDSVSYSDFKTGRFFVDASPEKIKEVSAKLNEAFAKSNKEFKSYLADKGLVRESDLNQQMFHLGMSTDPDLASIAARKAKDKDRLSHSLLDAESLAELEADRSRITKLFKNLQDSPKLQKAFDENGRLKLKIVEVYRKNKTPESFKAAIKENIGLVLSLADSKRFITLFMETDVLSPSLIIEERTSVAVDSTPFGAFSLDFVGLGAKNLRSTLEGVDESSDAPGMIKKIREKEQEVTEDFRDQKMRIYELIDNYFKTELEESFINRSEKETEPHISFSGDEGIIVPYREVTARDQLEIQRRLFGLFGYAQLRMTFIKADSEGKLQTNLVSTGENLEKAFKKKLLSGIMGSTLEQIQFNIFIPNVDAPVKSAFLYLYMPEALSDVEKAFLKETFPIVVNEVNANRSEGEAEIKPGGDIYAIIGDSAH